MSQELILWLVVASGVIAALYGWLQTQAITKASAGTDRMKEIAAAIQAGAKAYLLKESAFDELAEAIEEVGRGRVYLSRKIAGVVVGLSLLLLPRMKGLFVGLIWASRAGEAGTV